MKESAGDERPIFLIGAARSGTTLIGDLLSAHPQVAYWVEPKYVWRHGNAGAADDARSPAQATERVARYIREAFARMMLSAGKQRFLEKTPSNCFRVSFMHRIFPQARFLHVLRSGEDVTASALARWRSPPDDGAILRRIRGWEVPLLELPYYLPDIMREAVLRRLRPRRGYLWGPKYPGIHDDARTLGVPELCARQWVESVRVASRELAALPGNQVFTFKYEDFIVRPGAMLQSIMAFAGLPPSDEVYGLAGLVRDRGGTFDSLPEAERRVIRGICAPVMRELGLN